MGGGWLPLRSYGAAYEIDAPAARIEDSALPELVEGGEGAEIVRP